MFGVEMMSPDPPFVWDARNDEHYVGACMD
jgi:hypothetical protein